jgi:predicted branched-subunit amino acid permease
VTPRAAFLAGWRDSRSLGLVAGLFGLLFGVAAVAADMAPATAVLLSATVLAGSAQFAALALWDAPIPLSVLAVTTALVGARHVLMGITLAPIARPAPRWQRWAGAAILTDFNWAITVTAPPERRRFAYFLGSGLWLYVLWNVGTLAGVLVPDLLDAEVRTAAAGAGTLVLAGLATVLVAGAGRGALAPVVAAVAVVAVVTYATRLAGLLLGGAWAERPGVREALTVLPACALVGVVVPGLRAGEPALWLATALTVAVYLKTRHTPVAVFAGFLVLVAAVRVV